MQVGDVVKLKSGGPNMTVVGSVGDGPKFECAWFTGYVMNEMVGTQQNLTAIFPEEALALVPAVYPPSGSR